MHYAFLVMLSCYGFECQIDIVDQWQSEDIIEIMSHCAHGELENPEATCIFDSEEM